MRSRWPGSCVTPASPSTHSKRSSSLVRRTGPSLLAPARLRFVVSRCLCHPISLAPLRSPAALRHPFITSNFEFRSSNFTRPLPPCQLFFSLLPGASRSAPSPFCRLPAATCQQFLSPKTAWRFAVLLHNFEIRSSNFARPLPAVLQVRHRPRRPGYALATRAGICYMSSQAFARLESCGVEWLMSSDRNGMWTPH